MYLQGYSVCVNPGRQTSEGYVIVNHGAPYSITLYNANSERCDAYLCIDDKFIGCYRIQSRGHITIERPLNDTGKFTFYRNGSDEFRAVYGNDVDRQDRGLIKVVFRPERVPAVTSVTINEPWFAGTLTTYTANATRCCNLESGATGLSGVSHQKFDSTAPLDYDPDRAVTIYLRLVVNDDPRPLKAVSSPIPDCL